MLLPLLGFAACQGAPETPTSFQSSAEPPPGYVAEVLAAKQAPEPDIEERIGLLQKRYGVRSDDLIPGATRADKLVESLSQALVAPPAGLEVLYSEANAPAAKGFRRTIRVEPGALVNINAYAVGASDPMLFLIQFDDPSFKTSGRLLSSAQNKFRIVAWDDDNGESGFSSRISWSAGPSDGGYYMILAAPFSNNSRGKVFINYLQVTPGRVVESYDTPHEAGEPLVGGIVRSRGFGSNHYETTSSTNVDPWLFVFKTSQMVGSSNDDNSGTNSVVNGLTFGHSDLVFLSAYNGNGTVNYRQGFASACKLVDAGTTRRCVTERADETVDFHLSNRVPTVWEEAYTQKSHTSESNWCGPVAGENLLFWYGKDEPIAGIGAEMKTNAWGDWNTILQGCLGLCPSVADVSSSAPDVPLDPLCYSTCVATAGIVFAIITEAGTLPEDLKRTLDRRRPAGYHTVTGSQISPTELKQALRAGSPVIVLSSKAENRLHWTVATGLFTDGAGTLRVRLANESVSPTIPEFLEMTSLERVGRWKGVMSAVGVVPTYYYWDKIELITRQ